MLSQQGPREAFAVADNPQAPAGMPPTDIRNPDYFHKVVDCQWACPAHTPVPEYIRLIAAGRYTDAYPGQLALERLPRHPWADLRPSM